MNICYRSIGVEDAEAFWNMMYELDKETTYMMYEPGERIKNLNIVNNVIDRVVNGDDFLLLALSNDEIVGYISAQKGHLKRNKHSVCVVVGIRKEFQQQGIGTSFFKMLDGWAKLNNISRLELTVVSSNVQAIELYKKSGFFVEGIRKNSMIIDGNFVDELYMAKLL